MVGLIHKILFDLIESQAGAAAVLQVKQQAGVPADQTFRMNEVYADDEWQRLLTATYEVLGITPEQATEAYADHFCRDAMKRWPVWFQKAKTAREFLELQPLIHSGFASGVQDPETRQVITDKFRLEKRPNELIVYYRSVNKLCALYMALARWIINHYGDDAQVESKRCMKRGDDECEIRVRWNSNGAAS